MKTKVLKTSVLIVLSVISMDFYGQNFPNVTVPQPAQFPNYQNLNQNWTNPQNNVPKVPNPTDILFGKNEQDRIKRQNEQLIREVQINEQLQIEAQKQMYADLKMEKTNFGLPSLNHVSGTEYYKKAVAFIG